MCATAVSPQNSIATHAGAAFFCRELTARDFHRLAAPRILVAGCGAGHEAAAIADCFDAEVDAIDLDLQVDADFADTPRLTFQSASVCQLPFADETFDAVFYHHVIEHVDDPAKSLGEIARTLRPGGWLFVGTPNRHRLVSSVGAHRQIHWEGTVANKLNDNWQAWKARLQGRFRNELGAHAGFSKGELDRLLKKHFAERLWLTDKYLRFKYAGRRSLRPLIRLATCPGLSWFAAPSIYVLCRKAAPDRS